MEKLDEKGTKANVKGNILLGLAGAVIGTVPGIIIWVIVGQLGYFAELCGLAIAFGAALGCDVLGKCERKKTLVMSVFVIILATFAAVCLNDVVHIMRRQHFSITDATALFTVTLRISEKIRMEFIKSAVLGYVFSFLGSLGVFFMLKKQPAVNAPQAGSQAAQDSQ